MEKAKNTKQNMKDKKSVPDEFRYESFTTYVLLESTKTMCFCALQCACDIF